MILFAVLVADFFCRFRLVRTEKAVPAAAAVKADVPEAAEIPEAPAQAEIPADAAEAAAQAGEEVSNEQ